MVAMLAPSFPIVWEYPGIVSRLRTLGFAGVVEVSIGAKKTNEELTALLEHHPDLRCITSPCPTIVRMIRKQFPQYARYFPEGVDSPMVATAKIVRQAYPGHRPVFIGPCIVKKLEAQEDHPELDILVVTFAEMDKIFEHLHIGDADDSVSDQFDLSEPGLTRLYPVDGGLSHSAGIAKQLGTNAVRIVSGWERCMDAIVAFDQDPSQRLLDILYCEGGCIGGPGIVSPLDTQQRKERVQVFSGISANPQNDNPRL